MPTQLGRVVSGLTSERLGKKRAKTAAQAPSKLTKGAAVPTSAAATATTAVLELPLEEPAEDSDGG